jgi:hypothetical protein
MYILKGRTAPCCGDERTLTLLRQTMDQKAASHILVEFCRILYLKCIK